MNNDKVKKIYNDYLSKKEVRCTDEKEIQKVLEEYKKNGKIISGYDILHTDDGKYIVWKDDYSDKNIDEFIALIQVQEAKNIKTIKNCVLFFTILTILSAVIYIIILLQD